MSAHELEKVNDIEYTYDWDYPLPFGMKKKTKRVKLNEEQVHWIKGTLRLSKRSHKDIAKEFEATFGEPISRSMITSINTGRLYKDMG